MRHQYWIWFCRISVTAGIFCLVPTLSEARPFRINLIPNGPVNGCANCHINPAGSGARNAFGKAVGALVTPNGQEEFWSAALAAADSDGDGASNGLELQDPAGAWKRGDPQPGDSSKVTKPGDPNSKPVVSAAPLALDLTAAELGSTGGTGIDLSGLYDTAASAPDASRITSLSTRFTQWVLILTKVVLSL